MKIFTGKVVSKKMAKTASVLVERAVVHPVYKKRVIKSKKYQVHDETDSQVGQQVKFVASRPFSKTKKWKIIEVVKPDSAKSKEDKKSEKKEAQTKESK